MEFLHLLRNHRFGVSWGSHELLEAAELLGDWSFRKLGAVHFRRFGSVGLGQRLELVGTGRLLRDHKQCSDKAETSLAGDQEY